MESKQLTIEFNFFDAHDLFISRDTSKPETIGCWNLRERMKNAKQVVLAVSKDGKRKGGDGESFLAYEIEGSWNPSCLW